MIAINKIAGGNIDGMDASSPDANQEVNGSPAKLKETGMSKMAELDHELKDMGPKDPEDSYLYDVLGSMNLDDPITTDEVVEGQTTANKYLYVIAKLRNEIEDVKKVGQDQIESAQAYIDRQSNKREKTIDFLSERLHLFMMGQDQKTISLPNGDLKMRAKQDKVHIPDQTVVIEWAEKTGTTSILNHKTTVFLAEVKRYIKETGDIPDGVEVESQEPSFSVVT